DDSPSKNEQCGDRAHPYDQRGNLQFYEQYEAKSCGRLSILHLHNNLLRCKRIMPFRHPLLITWGQPIGWLPFHVQLIIDSMMA
ncbi:hypothetical protein QCF01_17665, partial [Staphylococcus aureus]|nr:hypothetical protein [Staphylococcus aureus]